MEQNEVVKQVSLTQSIVPILVLIVLLTLNVILFGDDATYGANQIALILAAATASVIAVFLGNTWKYVQSCIIKSIGTAMSAILILLLIGSLTGTWLVSGIVPALIYYGLDILNPTIFLFAACVISALVSLATGSSWTTAGTIGVALVGIGSAMGISEGVVVGAVISGAYFGDKMSPMSDTTNLASAMAGTDLFTHIKYMTYTTVPSIVITLVIFLIWGFTIDSTGVVGSAEEVQMAISSKFDINYWLFIVPLVVIVLIAKKVAAIPALFIGALLGGVFAVIFQQEIVLSLVGAKESSMINFYAGIVKAMFAETTIVTGSPMVDELLSAKGMFGMMNTVWLIMCAMIFGGALESAGMLKRITQSIIKFANSTGSLVLSTASTCVFFNVTSSDQYISIVVPGRMYSSTYRDRKLAPENLSRTLEDAGTVTSVLIPWNTCGAYHSGVLGVGTLTYLPFCFFNIISPLMTIFFAYAGIKIRKLKDGNENNA